MKINNVHKFEVYHIYNTPADSSELRSIHIVKYPNYFKNHHFNTNYFNSNKIKRKRNSDDFELLNNIT